MLFVVYRLTEIMWTKWLLYRMRTPTVIMMATQKKCRMYSPIGVKYFNFIESKCISLFNLKTFYKKFIGFNVRGIHTTDDQIAAVKRAECVFIGGGNTFLLLKKLIELALIEPIRQRALETAMPYIGSSAGTNVATVSIHTTNDMPIVYPPRYSKFQFQQQTLNR